MGLKKELLDILVCPKCKGELDYRYGKEREALICRRCSLLYPVEDGIP
ncbi:Trm112 family protein, partial [Candidatus Aerophobetes bacterium]|nr:Trm112 family protein [Candidatus Aerophobetes bacterium]